MAGTTIIGRVSVKVNPDTSGFRRDLKNDLDRIEDGLEVEVPANLDADHLRQEMRRVLNELKRQVKKSDLSVGVDLEARKVLDEAKALDEKLKRTLNDKTVSVKADAEGLDNIEQKVKRTRTELDKLARPNLFDNLRHQELFDPSSVDQFKSRIKEINDEVRATSKLDAQRTKGLAEQNRELAKQRDYQDQIAKGVANLAGGRARRQADAIAESLADAADQVKKRQQFEAGIEKQLAAEAREAEKLAVAAKKAADEAEKCAREIGRINLSKEVERTAERTADLLAEVDEELREIAKHENLEIEVNLDAMTRAERDLSRMQDRLNDLHLKLDIEEDEGKRREILHQVANLKDDIEKQLEDIEAEIEPTLLEVSMRSVQARLAYLARTRLVTLIPKVSKAGAAQAATALAALSGARLGGDLLKNLKDLVKNLDKNIPKITALGLGIAGLSGWALSASANLFSLSSELAQIGPLALALPGILSGLIIALGISVIAFSQMGKVIPEVVDKWGTLKGVISDNFWKRAAKPIKEMTERIFPSFSKGMAKAATEMGGFFGSLGSNLSKELAGNPLKNMFDDLSESIAITTTKTDAMARIVRILGEQGAGLLPRLARYFGDVTDRFSNFLILAENSGDMQDWIDNAISKLKDLGRAVYQVGRFFSALGKIANQAGGSKLKDVAQTFKDAADKLNEAKVRDQFVNVLKAADQAMTNIANESGPGVQRFFSELGKTASDVLPLIGTTIGELVGGLAEAFSGEGFQTGLREFFLGIQSFVRAIKPAFKPAADALGSLLTLAGDLAKAFGPSLSTILATVSNIFTTLAPYIGDAAKAISSPFGDVLKEIAPSLERIAKAVGPKIADFAKAFGKFLGNIKPDVGKVFGKVADFVETASKGFDAESFKTFFDSLTQLAKGGLGLLGDVFDFLKWISGPDGENARKAFELLAAAIEQMAGALSGLHNSIKAMNGEDIPEPKMPDPNNWWNQDLFGPLADKLRERIATNFREMRDQLVLEVTALWPLVKAAFMTGLRSAFGSEVVMGLLGPVGGFLVDGLLNGFTAAWGRVTAWWSVAVSGLIALVKGLLGIHSPSTVFIAIGSDIIAGLLQGLREKLGQVLTVLGDLAAKIKGVFAGAGSWLLGAGRGLVSGLASGIRGASGLASGAARAVKEAVRVAATAPGLLVSAGRAFVTGMSRAMQAAKGLVTSAARGLLQAARSGASGAGSALASAGQNIGRGLANGMRSMLGTVRSIAAQLASSAAAAVRSKLSIRSPSRLMHQYGVWTGEGFTNGMASQVRNVYAASANMANGAVKAIKAPATMLYAAGTSVGQSLAAGIKDSTRAVVKSVDIMAGVLTGAELAVALPQSASISVSRNVSASASEDPGSNATGKNVTFNYTANNPLPENPSTTVTKGLRLASTLEIV